MRVCQAFSEADRANIVSLYARAFSDAEGESEGALIGRLVEELMRETTDDDLHGFVATNDEQIVGCIFFSRLTFDVPIDAFLLSPVAVDTSQQGKGVGQALIHFGIERLRELDVELVFTYGDPNYYSKVGFRPVPQDVVRAPFALSQPEGWLGQSLTGGSVGPLSGTARCVSAFDDPDLW